QQSAPWPARHRRADDAGRQGERTLHRGACGHHRAGTQDRGAGERDGNASGSEVDSLCRQGQDDRPQEEQERVKHWIGAHTVDVGGMDMAIRRAANAGMNTMQLFTAIPKFYGDKTSIRGERVDRFKTAIREMGMDPSRFVTHGAYVLNTGTPDADKWTRARDGLTKELERSSMLGIGI